MPVGHGGGQGTSHCVCACVLPRLPSPFLITCNLSPRVLTHSLPLVLSNLLLLLIPTPPSPTPPRETQIPEDEVEKLASIDVSGEHLEFVTVADLETGAGLTLEAAASLVDALDKGQWEVERIPQQVGAWSRVQVGVF